MKLGVLTFEEHGNDWKGNILVQVQADGERGKICYHNIIENHPQSYVAYSLNYLKLFIKNKRTFSNYDSL